MNISRRNFIASLSLLPAALAHAQSQVPANKNIKWAVSSNLWGYFPGSMFTDMMDVMSATGFPGIRLANFPGCLNKFGMTAAQLQTEMSKRKLNVVTISWNSLSVDPAMRQQTLDSAREAMKFLADFGANHLVVFSPGLNRGGTAAPGAFEEMCKRCNEIGELAGTMGFTAGVHNHLGQMVQTREQIDRFMTLVDPKLFGFSPDTAHLQLAGCDVAGTIDKYKSRIKFLDYKDAKLPAPTPAPTAAADGTVAARPAGGGGFIQNIYDLGDGEVDFPGCHRILKGMKYKGWICVDLDIARLKPMADYVRCGTYVVKTLEPIYM